MERKLSALPTEGWRLSPRRRGCSRVFGCFGELWGTSSRNCRSREATAAPVLPPVGLAARCPNPTGVFLGQEQPLCYRTPAAPISAHRCHGFRTPAQQGGVHTQTKSTATRSVHQVNHKTSAKLLLATSCTFPLLHSFLTPLLPSQPRILTHRGFRWPCTVLPHLRDAQGSCKTPLLGGRHAVAPPQWYKPTPFPHQTRF